MAPRNTRYATGSNTKKKQEPIAVRSRTLVETLPSVQAVRQTLIRAYSYGSWGFVQPHEGRIYT